MVRSSVFSPVLTALRFRSGPLLLPATQRLAGCFGKNDQSDATLRRGGRAEAKNSPYRGINRNVLQRRAGSMQASPGVAIRPSVEYPVLNDEHGSAAEITEQRQPAEAPRVPEELYSFEAHRGHAGCRSDDQNGSAGPGAV